MDHGLVRTAGLAGCDWLEDAGGASQGSCLVVVARARLEPRPTMRGGCVDGADGSCAVDVSCIEWWTCGRLRPRDTRGVVFDCVVGVTASDAYARSKADRDSSQVWEGAGSGAPRAASRSNNAAGVSLTESADHSGQIGASSESATGAHAMTAAGMAVICSPFSGGT
eukprot:9480275-Pyramimonas_sp.AAC.1